MDDTELKRELTAVWDAGAATYDGTPRHGILDEDEEAAWRRLAAAIFGDPRRTGVPIRRVLDVGTGTGLLALLAAELGHEVHGIDLSEAMLDRARRKGRDRHLDVAWEIGDAEAPPYAPSTFDVVAARHLVWTLPHPAEAMATWATLVRPDGLVVVLDGAFRAPPRPFDLPIRIAAALVERRARAEADDDHAYRPEHRARLPFARQRDPRAIVGLMEAAGLGDVKVRPLGEIERIERARQGWLQRLADRWVRYLATGRRSLG